MASSNMTEADPNPSSLVRFARSKTTWRPGRIFAERQFHGYDEAQEAYISEVGATCVATQVEGANVGMQEILNIQKQIPSGIENPGDVGPGDLADTKPCRYDIWASYDFTNLKTLTQLGCSCTPKLLGHKLVSQGPDDYVPGGFILYLLIEKLAGRNLVDFAQLPMFERDQVRLAFAKAIYTGSEFYALRHKHNDPDRRNLIWDPKGKKCYIVVLEDAYSINDDAKPAKFRPSIDWFNWNIAGPTLIAGDGVDSMMPYDDYKLTDPDDETLLGMMKNAAGKGVYIPNYSNLIFFRDSTIHSHPGELDQHG
ncbi:hypothetical protein AJ79_00079 [Helicocarpus griseus UAMH5409]|uniref:Aminoglycoside phosphotransferase domain-containing protein n=1 Tax=Helicocarpus griseus UAMH5409 TaxID=1447875 RepID=A0A2B7YCQ1_9EURO|nr:hypothetical protein AJ79_00079 [Helicocarpus griseus UAMH5409]